MIYKGYVPFEVAKILEPESERVEPLMTPDIPAVNKDSHDDGFYPYSVCQDEAGRVIAGGEKIARELNMEVDAKLQPVGGNIERR